MKKITFLFCCLLFLISCNKEQNAHVEPTHNFTVNRLIVLNDKGEVLMGKEEGNWYTLSHVYNERQFIKECLDSLSNEYGITTTTPQLHGYFSYKYEYHPYSTLRSFYVAQYLDGDIKPVGNMTEMKWMSKEDAIALTPVESMKLGIKQILENPDTLWSGSFMIYRKGEHHHARLIEDFYPLFK